MPSGEDIDRHYPPLAQAAGKEGRAVVHCQVTATGTLTACEVAEEQPAGWGFGKAALAMTGSFRMRPAAGEDGRSIEGASVTIPIRFQLS